jgi:hypothetical protein
MPSAFRASKTQMPVVPECKPQKISNCFRSTRSQSRAPVDECSGGSSLDRLSEATSDNLKNLKRLNVDKSTVDCDKQKCKKKPRTTCSKSLDKCAPKVMEDNSSLDPSLPSSTPPAAQSEYHSLSHVMTCFQGDGPGIVVGRAEERNGTSSSQKTCVMTN